MSNRAKAFLLLLIDSLILIGVLSLVILIRNKGEQSSEYLLSHYKLFAILYPIWIIMYFIEGLYSLRTYNPANLPISVIRGTLFSSLVSIIVIYLLPQGLEKITPKTNLILIAVIVCPALYSWRLFFFRYFGHSKRLRGTILVGSDETLQMVEEEITNKPHLGYKIVSTYEPTVQSIDITPDVELIAIERNVARETALYRDIFGKLGELEIIDLAKFAEKISGKIPIKAIDESWFIEYCGHNDSRSYDALKTFIDKAVAVFLLIALIPVATILLPILLFAHGRPIFFKQMRTGHHNKPFKLYKLRTMVKDAEKAGAQWAKPGDARITPLGKILRKTRLDELPQLINIIRGEMSLVGPRPERPEIIEKQLAPIIPYYNLRHLVKPGVTGWAQVTFRYGFSTEDSKEKLQFDLFYVKNRSIWLDVIVILKTIKTILTGAGQ
jgi:exopolysaccharide biosynthesis polyprenyl glycosylphosphotransferase